MSIRFASTFLSHASIYKDLVNEVANELSRRGVLAWLDKDELSLGMDLPSILFKSAEKQLTMTTFISTESLASPWCNEELRPCLEASGTNTTDKIIPVYLGDPLALVKSSPLLRSHLLTPDGTRVSLLGEKIADFASADAASIARKIARTHYHRLAMNECTECIVAVDQRGHGNRIGEPDLLPENWLKTSWPVLVFRPDRGERSTRELLRGKDWEEFRDCIAQTLGQAMGSRRQREVYITGNMQLACAWLLGWYFDRSNGIKLVTHNPRGGQTLMIDMTSSAYFFPPAHIDPTDIDWDGPGPDSSTREISVYLGFRNYLDEVRRYRASIGDSTPLATRITEIIGKEEEVHDLAQWLCTVATGRSLCLYTSLPAHVLPLLAALLRNGTGPVTIMERDYEHETYCACPMPKGT